MSHLREERTGDRGSGELRQIELGRGAGAASRRCGRSAPSGRTVGRALLSFLDGCRPSAPVFQARLAILAAARPRDRIIECTWGQALLLDGLDLVQIGAEAEPDAGESGCQSGCTCERRAQLTAERIPFDGNRIIHIKPDVLMCPRHESASHTSSISVEGLRMWRSDDQHSGVSQLGGARIGVPFGALRERSSLLALGLAQAGSHGRCRLGILLKISSAAILVKIGLYRFWGGGTVWEALMLVCFIFVHEKV